MMLAHAGHHHSDTFSLEAIYHKSGVLHLLLLHFPIALLVTTVLAELLYIWKRDIFYDHAAKFLIISAVIFSIPTVFFGLALAASQDYGSIMGPTLEWHKYCGIITGILITITAIIREKKPSSWSYFFFLLASFLMVNVTGYLGGILTFGTI